MPSPRVTYTRDSKVNVTWESEENPSKALLGYVLEVSVNGEEDSWRPMLKDPTMNSEAIIEGAIVGNQYMFRVNQISSGGLLICGSPSIPVLITNDEVENMETADSFDDDIIG